MTTTGDDDVAGQKSAYAAPARRLPYVNADCPSCGAGRLYACSAVHTDGKTYLHCDVCPRSVEVPQKTDSLPA